MNYDIVITFLAGVLVGMGLAGKIREFRQHKLEVETAAVARMHREMEEANCDERTKRGIR